MTSPCLATTLEKTTGLVQSRRMENSLNGFGQRLQLMIREYLLLFLVIVMSVWLYARNIAGHAKSRTNLFHPHYSKLLPFCQVFVCITWFVQLTPSLVHSVACTNPTPLRFNREGLCFCVAESRKTGVSCSSIFHTPILSQDNPTKTKLECSVF